MASMQLYLLSTKGFSSHPRRITYRNRFSYSCQCSNASNSTIPDLFSQQASQSSWKISRYFFLGKKSKIVEHTLKRKLFYPMIHSTTSFLISIRNDWISDKLFMELQVDATYLSLKCPRSISLPAASWSQSATLMKMHSIGRFKAKYQASSQKSKIIEIPIFVVRI